jgi:hypothetical protein
LYNCESGQDRTRGGWARLSKDAGTSSIIAQREECTVEGRFAQLAKRKETADQTETPAIVPAPAAEKPNTKSVKIGKLPPRNKSRLPRRQKKALQKAAARG